MTRRSDAALDRARRIGDPALDPLVSSLPGPWSILARQPRADGELALELLPFAAPPLPAWACVHRLRRAQTFAQRNLALLTAALFCAALPTSYLSVPGARVLSHAGGLGSDIDRRIHHTASFVLGVWTVGAFDPGGIGSRIVGRVRLVHAAVRASLARDPTWTDEPNEVPINQEDLLGALGLFSVISVRALERMGAVVDARDREDFVHLWAVVADMLGIEVPPAFGRWPGAAALTDAIGARQMRGGDQGRALMEALVAGMRRHMPLSGLHEVPVRLTSVLVGERRAAMLGLPRTRPAGAVTRALGRRLTDSGLVLGLARRFGQELVWTLHRHKQRDRLRNSRRDRRAP